MEGNVLDHEQQHGSILFLVVLPFRNSAISCAVRQGMRSVCPAAYLQALLIKLEDSHTMIPSVQHPLLTHQKSET
eukprot:4704108-Amphidinium_carterae.1